jgi:hypothetical protein
MRTCLGALVVGFALMAAPASAQTCPTGQPASAWPGPAFVPTADCQGWVPANHPSASANLPRPTGEMPPAALVAQDIYTNLEGLPSQTNASTGIRSFGGWAVDCALGSFPPVIKITETKPDGSSRDVPNDYFYAPGLPRPDVQAAIGGACPAVYNVPSQSGGLGSNQSFGWTLQLRTPIQEVGVHTFTVTFSWPQRGHSGASSVTVTIFP